MSITKIVLAVSGLVLATFFIGGIFVILNFTILAKNMTERMASETLGVEVKIEQFSLSIKDQRVTVGGLTIGNPQGFENDYAMTVGSIEIALDSITDEIIHFKNIAVTDTDVNLEVNKRGTNLSVIKGQMKSKPKPTESTAQRETVKVIVDRLVIMEAQLNPSVVLFSSSQDLAAVSVSDIILRDIGKRENGVLVRQMIMQVWNSISLAVNDSAGTSGFYKGLSPDALKHMGTGQVDSIKKQIQGDVKGFGSAIKGMF